MTKILEKNVAILIVIALFTMVFLSSCGTGYCAYKNSNGYKTYNMCPAYH